MSIILLNSSCSISKPPCNRSTFNAPHISPPSCLTLIVFLVLFPPFLIITNQPFDCLAIGLCAFCVPLKFADYLVFAGAHLSYNYSSSIGPSQFQVTVTKRSMSNAGIYVTLTKVVH